MEDIDEKKVVAFVFGQHKKSRFQKRKEEREAKRRKGEADTARVYDAFAASFAAPAPGAADGRKAFVAAGAAPTTAKGQMDSLLKEIAGGDPSSAAPPLRAAPAAAFAPVPSVVAASKPKPSRAIDAMLDEFKLRAAQGRTAAPRSVVAGNEHSRARPGGGSFAGSAVSDACTTNLFVGNLAPSVTEEVLLREFSRFGPIVSTKVIWPRTAEKRAEGRNNGFVAFKTRCDAEDAAAAMDGRVLPGHGTQRHKLRINWGKAVDSSVLANARAMTVPAGGALVPGADVAAPMSVEQLLSASAAAAAGAPRGDRTAMPADTPARRIVRVTTPRDATRAALIVRVAKSVAADGGALEARLRALATSVDERHALRFLDSDGRRAGSGVVGDEHAFYRKQNDQSEQTNEVVDDEHAFYRWRVAAFVMGESETEWRSAAFQMFRNGKWWVPPPALPAGDAAAAAAPGRGAAAARRKRTRANAHDGGGGGDEAKSRKYRTGAERERELSRRHGLSGPRLSKHRHDALRAMLSDLAISRTSVGDTMGFCIKNAEASEDVVRIIVDSLVRGAREASAPSDASADTASAALPDASAIALPDEAEGEGGKRVRGMDVVAGTVFAPTLPLSVLVAHLYAISDILHNSTAKAKNAASYRRLFEPTLARVCSALGCVYNRLASRMTAATLKEKVLAVLHTWEHWSLFPPFFLFGLEATFLDEGALDVGGPPSAAREALAAQLEMIEESDVDAKDLRRKCKLAGVRESGDGKQLMLRLHGVNAFVRARRGGGGEEYDPSRAVATAGVGSVGVGAYGAAAARAEAVVVGAAAEREEEEEEEEEEEGGGGDIDGVSLDDDDDIDGVPLGDDDIDGAPF